MKRLYDKALIEQIAKVYGNETKFLSAFSRALLDIIREGLVRDGHVRLHQFGSFKLKWMNTRNGYNPATGKRIIIQGRPRVIFTPAKALKENVEPHPAELIPLDDTNTVATKPVNVAVAAAAASAASAANISTGQSHVPSNSKSDTDVTGTDNVADQVEVQEPEAALVEKAVEKAVEKIVETSTDSKPNESSDNNKNLEESIEVVTPAKAVENQLSENDKQLAQQRDVTEELTIEADTSIEYSKPVETVVENLQDEIEILQQVVEILKTEQPKVTSESFDAFNDADPAGISVDTNTETIINVTADTSTDKKLFVEQIKEISELAYFKEVTADNGRASSQVTQDEKIKSDEILDIGLDKSFENNSSQPTNEHGYRWLLLAASVVLLVAASILLTTIWSDRSSNTLTTTAAIESHTASDFTMPVSSYYLNDELSDSKSGMYADEQASNEASTIAVNDAGQNYLESKGQPDVEAVAQISSSTTLYGREVNQNTIEDNARNAEVAVEHEAESTQVITAKGKDSTVTQLSQQKTEILAENNNTQTETALVTVRETKESEKIIVSSEQYHAVKRATSEQNVYFLERNYQLINGDSLWRLAKKHYVNPFYWPHIYQANRRNINNPDRVKIGRVVLLPTLFGEPDALTKRDKRNIAMGYYFNYLYHKQRGNPRAYFSLIGVDRFDAGLLIEFQEEISRSDVNNLALLSN